MNKLILLAGCALGCAAVASAQSGPQRLGERNPLNPPFIEVFDDYPAGSEHDQFERRFQVINSDGDLNTSGTPRSWGFYNFNGESNGRQYSKCAYLLYPINVTFADDWLISRAINLEAGKYYHVSMDASLFSGSGVHTLEVKIGEYNDAEGMEFTIVPATEVSTIYPQQVEGWFKPQFDSKYYLGIHGISGRTASASDYLFVDNIAMDAPRTGREPAQVTDVEFVNDPDATPSVDISFKAPAVGVDGQPITGDVTIVVKRDDKTIKTFTAAPGQALQLTDALEMAGNHVYTIAASNSVGAGCDLKINQFVGMDRLPAPVIASISEPEPCVVRLEWEAPAADVRGTAINPDKIRYNVYEVLPTGTEMVGLGIEGTQFDVRKIIDAGCQEIVTLAVSAVVNDQESQLAASDFIFVGDPYQLPYENHFTYSGEEYVIGAYGDDGILWRVLDDFSDPQSQDGDNSYICMVGTTPNQWGALTTGKVDFTSASHPAVSFWTYIYDDDENEFAVSFVDCATDERTEVAKYVLGQLGNIGWTRVLCPLDGAQGKVARVQFDITIKSHGYVPIDNMSIDELVATDLAVVNVAHDKYASADEPYSVTANITNYGAESVESYEVRLLCDGKAVDTVTAGPLESFASATIDLSARFSATSPEMPTFTVEVIADGDVDLSNNVSSPFNIAFLAPCHPVVTNLQGEESGSAVTLTWDAPDLSTAAPEESLEDFESYEGFATVLNGFTMYDADGGNIAGFAGADMPLNKTPQAYFVLSSWDYESLYTIGHNSLFAMATTDANRRPIRNDDWLISPELYGGRQSIGFKACSQTIGYGYETFEVYASSASTDIADFELVMVETAVGEEWEQFYVTLPAGTRYFAIRCTSNDCMLFTLDDITYIAKGDPRPLQFKGYNVYRNGAKLNTELVTANTFATTRELEGDDYFVTAVYDQGESTASNIVHLGVAGIDAIDTDAAPEYYDLRGLRVNPANLTPGLYIMRRGTSAIKVLIK